jgi:two-component system NtrC family sensor kinase
MQARRDATVRLLTLLLAAVLLVPAALFAYVSWLNYRATFELADERIQRSLDVVAEHAEKVFQSVNVTLTGVSEMIRGLSDEQARASEEKLHRQLEEVAAELPAVDAVWLFGKNGRPLASSYVFPVPANFDASDLDYYRVQLQRNAGTYVGEILPSRLSHAPFFPVSRRRSNADGSFAGVAVAAVLPGDFHRFYGHLATPVPLRRRYASMPGAASCA